MTTTNVETAVARPLTTDEMTTQAAMLPLIKEFDKAMRPVARAMATIAKQETIVDLNRAIAGRVFTRVLAVPAMTNKSGKPVASRIATALGLKDDAIALWIKAAGLVMIQVNAGELVLEETPSEAEIALFNSPWREAAKSKREKRAAAKAAKGEASDNETPDKDSRDSDGTKGGESDTVGLSFADIMVKVNELKATVELAAKNNVTVTEADNESLNEVMAGIMATLTSMS